MIEIIEIIIAVFAVFGIYALLDMLRFRLLFPPKLRERLRGAYYIDDGSDELCEVTAYVKYLRDERKISCERLLIISESGIINKIPQSALEDFEIIISHEPKEIPDDTD